MTPARLVRAYKCKPESSTASAWCESCNWNVKAGEGGTPKVCRSAKAHTQSSGHKTRIDISHQRGYYVVQ